MHSDSLVFVCLSLQTGFIGGAMLGRSLYSREDVRHFHCPMIENEGLRPEHVDIMIAHLKQVLQDIGASNNLIEVGTTNV